MNIFFLDSDPTTAARAHVDKHVVKMMLESAQLLSTACRVSGLDVGYKKTHVNHPCALWARHSIDNWRWLRSLALALEAEWKYRYRKTRWETSKSLDVVRSLPEPPIPSSGLSQPAQAMPNSCRRLNPVKAYRNYYATEKRHLASWTRRGAPDWWVLSDGVSG